MADKTGVRSLANALSDVQRWKASEEATNKKELGEVDQEVERLEAAVANLKQQLEALAKFRVDLESKGGALEGREIERSYTAIFEALKGQATMLATRAAKATEVEGARASELAAAMSSGDVAPLLKEYQQFKTTVEPTLSALPESYRDVIAQHHEQVVAKLKAHLGALTQGPVVLEGASAIEVDVAYAIDAPEGSPELLVMVLPLSAEVYDTWATRGEDLLTQFAARTVQAAYHACAKTGLAGAQAVFGGHQDLLAVEIDLLGASADFSTVLDAELKVVFADAPELKGCMVQAKSGSVSIDFLLPPEDEDEVNDA